MTTHDARIGQRFLVGFEGLTAPAYILDWLREGRISGVILFARNVDSPTQLAALTRQLHAATPDPLLIAIDQEGGMVARLRQSQGFTESPGAMAIAATPDNVAQSERMSRILADEMHALGINWTYAPVVDLSYNAENPTVGTRSYGRNPQQVGELAAAAVRGFQSGGVAACAKHFPGLGNTAVDSHLDLPVLDTPVESLIANDLAPYRHVINADVASVMTTHTLFTALDSDYPATLSPVIIQQLLRNELGFEGIVTTDCMEMHAITRHYGAGESAVLAALAGVDLILISHTRAAQEAAFDALRDAVANGRLSNANLTAADERIQQFKQRFAIDPAHITPDTVGSTSHQEQALQIAKAGVSLSTGGDKLPLPSSNRVGVVEFASYLDSDVMERNEATQFATRLLQHLSQIQTVALHAQHPTDAQISRATALADNVETLVVVTRNAHMLPEQQTLATLLLSRDVTTVLVALRNPYDADVLSADTVLCTFGDSAPSLDAAALALIREYPPTGTRPIAAEQTESS